MNLYFSDKHGSKKTEMTISVTAVIAKYHL